MYLTEEQSKDYGFIRRLIRQIRPHAFIERLDVQKGGKSAYAYCLNGSTIFKFPKTRVAKIRQTNETGLVRFLRDKVPLEIPFMQTQDDFDGSARDFAFCTYHKIPGRVLDFESFGKLETKTKESHFHSLSEFMAAMHGAASPDMTGKEGLKVPQISQYLRLSACKNPKLKKTLDYLFIVSRLLTADAQVVLCHNDMHPGNFILSDDLKSVQGVIDFELAVYGAPATEFLKSRYGADTSLFAKAYEDVTGRALISEKTADKIESLKCPGGIANLIYRNVKSLRRR